MKPNLDRFSQPLPTEGNCSWLGGTRDDGREYEPEDELPEPKCVYCGKTGTDSWAVSITCEVNFFHEACKPTPEPQPKEKE